MKTVLNKENSIFFFINIILLAIILDLKWSYS